MTADFIAKKKKLQLYLTIGSICIVKVDKDQPDWYIVHKLISFGDNYRNLFK